MILDDNVVTYLPCWTHTFCRGWTIMSVSASWCRCVISQRKHASRQTVFDKRASIADDFPSAAAWQVMSLDQSSFKWHDESTDWWRLRWVHRWKWMPALCNSVRNVASIDCNEKMNCCAVSPHCVQCSEHWTVLCVLWTRIVSIRSILSETRSATLHVRDFFLSR